MLYAILLTLTIVGLVLICCIGEWLPLDVVAISASALLMLFGLVTPEEGISGFGHSATITVMSMFILSAGISRTGVILQVTRLLVRWGGKHPAQQILTLGMIVGPITAFINNTAVVAVFLPIIEDWCKKQGGSISKLMIPLSYATILGGMITVIGTSTNVLASGISERLGYGSFGLFQFTPLGLISFALGLLYLSIMGPRLLPERGRSSADEIVDDYHLSTFISEVLIPEGSCLDGQVLARSCLKCSETGTDRYDVDVMEILRKEVRYSQPLDHKVLKSGDILLVRGSRQDLLKVKEENKLEILPEVKFKPTDDERDEECLAEVLIPFGSELIGSSLKDIRFRQRYNAIVLAVRRGQELSCERIGDIRLRFGDVLLVQGPKQSLQGLQTSRHLLVLNQQDIAISRTNKARIAILIGVGVVALAALDIVPILVSSLFGAILMVLTGCLKPGELYGAVRWDIIFLLAGLIPLGIAMEKSGATQWLAKGLAFVGGHLPGYWVLLLFFVVTSIMTEILSNNASVVLLIPIAAEVAQRLDLNPLALIFSVTFAASNSFMTPIGYQTNTMVYGPGGYKFTDFIRVGLPLNILMALIIPPLIIKIYGL